MKTTRFTKAQLLEDVEFLEWRARMAGGYDAGTPGQRCWGLSANQLVRFAYTGEHDHTLPLDTFDLAACARSLAMLPSHRRTPAVDARYQEFERVVRSRLAAKQQHRNDTK